jgi:penicillin-binding protein 2
LNEYSLKKRFTLFNILFLLFFICCTYRLIKLQIIKGEYYFKLSFNRLVGSSPIKAARGEILDRNGIPLISNRMGFLVKINKTEITNEILNSSINNLIKIAHEENITYIDTFPIKGKETYYFDFPYTEDDEKNKIKEWKKRNNFDENQTPKEVIKKFSNLFGISDKYSKEEKRNIIAVRYEMKSKAFGNMNPYVFANDVNISLVQKIKEQNENLPGVSIESEPIREYINKELAAHILGRVGIIYKEEYDQLKNENYGINDIIGKDGMEKILEKNLKGIDGTHEAKFYKNGKGNIIIPNKPAIPGHCAILTIDKNIQETAENSLKTKMKEISINEKTKVECGASVVVQIKTGEILALATCPSYNPAKFNEEYDILIKNPLKPLLNRALNGIYPPASTFKMVTALAALEEEVITPNDTINDTGIYMYYAPSYMPKCWKKNGHGKLDIANAIARSCNYFFYDIGRRTGITKLNEYSKKLGLGELTGIELSESQGILAGPEYRKKIKGPMWMPGNTIQAAIGQSDNAFTPAQLVNYIATLASGGTRYKLHLIKEIKSYDDGKILYKKDPEIISEINIRPENYEAIMKGVKGVMADNGTASSIFKNFPIILGGKTGTAEIYGKPNNALFVGFGPFEDPEIAVVTVIEKGLHGTYAAQVAKNIFETYFKKE